MAFIVFICILFPFDNALISFNSRFLIDFQIFWVRSIWDGKNWESHWIQKLFNAQVLQSTTYTMKPNSLNVILQLKKLLLICIFFPEIFVTFNVNSYNIFYFIFLSSIKRRVIPSERNDRELLSEVILLLNMLRILLNAIRTTFDAR